MTAARVRLLVAVAALATAGATVGITALTSDRPSGEAAKPRRGAPPLTFDLGVRVDDEARALRRGQRLYERRRRAEAALVFARFSSLEARVGLALARWPDGGVRPLETLAREHPRSAFVRLHEGFALFWAGLDREAELAWRAAKAVQPDSASAVRADDLLHPDFPPGLPTFVPTFRPPPAYSRLSPPRQLALLEAAAREADPRAKILYGIALQRLGRPLSARRQYAAAARLAPTDPEALTAAAVGRFTKAAPARAFAQLGPLSRRYPRAATVRFHLGLMLLWLARVEEARSQLRTAARLDPTGPIGRSARKFIEGLRGA